MKGIFQEIFRRNRLLAVVGGVHLSLFMLTLLLVLIDSRTVTGINVWIKPGKFMLSIAIYLWTLAWFCKYLPNRFWATGIVSLGASFSMLGETVCLWTQAIRGTSSHFNTATPLDGTIFGVMGTLILLNTVLLAYTLGLFLLVPRRIDRVSLWAIRLGLLIFLVGSAQGGMMIGRGAHAVGVPDDGPGVPVLNWSTKGGDLRIAHALGLHALQLIPLFGWFVGSRSKAGRKLSQSGQILLVLAFALLYLMAFWLLLNQALSGRPLVAL